MTNLDDTDFVHTPETCAYCQSRDEVFQKATAQANEGMLSDRVAHLETLFQESADGRMTLAFRYLAMEKTIADLQRQVQDSNRLYGILKGRLDGVEEGQGELEQQVQALTEGLRGVDENLAQHRHRPNGETVFAFEDECPSIGPSGIDWEVIGANIDAMVEPTPAQPAADDADEVEPQKWMVDFLAEEVLERWDQSRGVASWVVNDPMVREYFSAPRIDPSAPEQIRVVAEQVGSKYPSVDAVVAYRILTALRDHLEGGK